MQNPCPWNKLTGIPVIFAMILILGCNADLLSIGTPPSTEVLTVTAAPLESSSPPRAQVQTQERLQETPVTAAPTMEPCRLLTLDRPVHTDSEWRIDPTYRFGSTHNGTRDPHHGVEFYNPQGTPALAAGAGVVVFAGEDFPVPVGPVPGFYGKAVILKINTPSPPDLFVLYGHLSEILVTEGQIVASGQLVGLIGATGYATGAHLHFEVRVSENSYEMVQNPELWLRPADGTGTLAGRLPRDVSSIEIRSVQLDREGNLLWFLQPYQFADTEDFFHPGLDEMLAVTDLPAGLYTVKVVYNGVELRTIRIHPNRLSWFAFDSSEPPASPCLW